MAKLTLRRNGSIRRGGRHVGWIVRHYEGHLLIGLAPYRDVLGRLGNGRQVFLAYPHDRFWPRLTAWTGHLNVADIETALTKLAAARYVASMDDAAVIAARAADLAELRPGLRGAALDAAVDRWCRMIGPRVSPDDVSPGTLRSFFAAVDGGEGDRAHALV